jgi:branched-chain amino acid transport system permease protein
MGDLFNAALFSQQLVNGLALGSIYAMIAVGLAMIYGVLRVLHIAHAGIYTAGAYLGLFFFTLTGSLAAAVIAAMIIAGLIGVLIERFIYRPMLPKPRIVALIASIGLFICLSDLFRILAGPHQLAFDVPAIAGRFTLAGITVSGADFLIFGGTAIIFGALWFIIQNTSMGFAIRAVAQDIETSKVMGIDVNRSVASVFFIGSAIAAFGGIMVAILYNAVYTSMGDMVGYKGLALIVIGGFGSMTGGLCLRPIPTCRCRVMALPC